MNTFIDPSEPIFSIADIADKLKVQQRTLRIIKNSNRGRKPKSNNKKAGG